MNSCGVHQSLFRTMKIIDRGQGIFDYDYEDFHLTGYNPHPSIKMEVSV